MSSDQSRTDGSLTDRVIRGDRDARAWGIFVDRYAPKIYGWCRAWKLQEADAQDVTQAVLLRLAGSMGRFRYDPDRSFRGWLRRLTENAWKDWLAERRRAAGPGTDLEALLGLVEARDDLVRRLASEFDLELLEEAKGRVRARILWKTWEAYRLTADDGVAGAEVAERLGMSVDAVFQARSRVLGLLRRQIRDLEGMASIPDDDE